MVELHLGLLQGRHHRLLHLRVARAPGGLGDSQGHVDASALDAKFLQRRHGGEHVQAVAIDNGVIWADRGCGTLASLIVI